jgi:hypothetical protein
MIDVDKSLRCALLSAREEAFLWDLIGDFRARFPEASISQCEADARESATVLLSNGWAQLVSTTWTSISSGSVVPHDEALGVLQDLQYWSPPPTNQDSCFHLLITESGREQPF